MNEEKLIAEMMKLAKVICSQHPSWKPKAIPAENGELASVCLEGSRQFVFDSRGYWYETLENIPGFRQACDDLTKLTEENGVSWFIDAPYNTIYIGLEED